MIKVRKHARNLTQVGGVHVGDIFYDVWGYEGILHISMNNRPQGKETLCIARAFTQESMRNPKEMTITLQRAAADLHRTRMEQLR